MKLATLCDEDTAVGLRLAGLKEIYVPKEDSTKIWKELSERDDIGIIFITEQIVEDLQRELKDFRLQNNIPIILEIPDKKGRLQDHADFVSHLIKKAVGVEISKEK
ncbi:MAG: V-type ATP synthase subunit F [Candidatus Thermoplasmatota archaeon]|nr:V-type ATP synthase subunit F [Candidatus Thermoplasmatota archaeon]